VSIRYSVLITTKDRYDELLYTLEKSSNLIAREDTEWIICDDGSEDTRVIEYLKKRSDITHFRNENSIGLIESRNKLLSMAKGDIAISIDDDAHFISENPFEEIDSFFQLNKGCAVTAFRIFWGKEELTKTKTNSVPKRVSGFVGCGHAWRMSDWHKTEGYPGWFVFYGEEDYAAYRLFKLKKEIWYLPSVLVQHRVDVKERKELKDYQLRLRRALRAGWYLMFLFFPLRIIPRRIGYSIITQIKKRTFKGDLKGTLAILLGGFDLLIHIPKLLKESNRLSIEEFDLFEQLPKPVIYWEPEY